MSDGSPSSAHASGPIETSGGDLSSAHGGCIITIATKRGRLTCTARDITPMRIGIIYSPPCMILEYMVKSRRLLAHHRMAVDLSSASCTPVAAAQAVAQGLLKEHAQWLYEVPHSQLEALAARLLSHSSDAAPLEPLGAVECSIVETTSADDAIGVHRLLYGPHKSNKASLPTAWLQSWVFEPLAAQACPYGLQQVEGGPCGIIAPVQAFLVRRLLLAGINPNTATPAQSQHALEGALTDILWQCSSHSAEEDLCEGVAARERHVRLLVTEQKPATKMLQSIEGCEVHHFKSRDSLSLAWKKERVRRTYFDEGSEQQGSGGVGVLLFLCSAMLTKSCAVLRAESDTPEDVSMIGAHGYCTQEAVNLLMTGVGVSNVFDGERDLGEPGSSDSLRLVGIRAQTQVGFLSLFEAYGSMQVGTHLKDPAWPVWVVHAESHYSILFRSEPWGHEEDAPTAFAQSDLWYYDPLGRQDEEKRITIRPNALHEPFPEDDLLSNGMIAKVIRTRWGSLADLDWNGSEPIL